MKAFVLILLFTLCLYALTCNGVKYYVFDSRRPGPHTLFLGSIHGDEEAGFHALQMLVNSGSIKPKSGKITVIPVANTCGLYTRTRNNPMGDYDINREFLDMRVLNSTILKFVHKADLVIDVHEGWGFHNIHPSSIGSGIYTRSNSSTERLVKQLIDIINKDIKDEKKKFTTHRLEPVVGSLQEYCNDAHINYILVETSGQRNIQPLAIRVNQIITIAQHIIQERHM